MVHESRRSGINGALRIPLVLLFLALAAGLGPAWSDDAAIQPFFGQYVGRTLMPMGEARNRDLRVAIRPLGAFGFTVEWETTLHKSGKQPEIKAQAVDFEPTRRPNVYAAARGGGSAGGRAPKGPADGEPYAWARLAGDTLTVNVLTITDTGDYVVQTYDRTLTPDGMRLEFMRVKNGRIERRIKAALKRVGD
jgi:hypothetical protein